MKEGKLYYAEAGQGWNDDTNCEEVLDYRCAYDGHGSKLLFPAGSRLFPVGDEWHGGPPNDTLTVHANTVPLVLLYRPFEFLRLQDCDIGTGQVRQDGNLRTLVLERRRDREWITFISVDPKRAFVPIHYVEEKSGHTHTDLTVAYDHGNGDGFIPAEWNWKDFDESGRLKQFSQVATVESKVNGTIADGVFEISFPQGSWVNEHVGSEHRVYLVLATGQRRYLSRAEANVNNYAMLMDPSLATARQRRRFWLTFLSTVCLVLALLVLVLRKRWGEHEVMPE